MLNNITIGQYFPGNSFLHRMDPRAKIIATTIFVVAIFLANSPLAYGIVGGFTIFAMLLSRLPLRLMWSAIKPLWINHRYLPMGFIFLRRLVIQFSNGELLILRIMGWQWVFKWRHD